jgi:hypothetical protein
MNRRELIKSIALLTGAAVVGGELFLSGCKTKTAEKTGAAFTANEITWFDEVADTIIPDTPGVPGAKAAKLGEFMKVYVTDCYTKEDQQVFREGFDKLEAAAKQKFSNEFLKLTPAQRTELLNAIDKEATAYQKTRGEKNAEAKKANPDAKDLPAHYFTMVKQLTLLGYFTSEVGATKALRYLPVPGRYDGAYPYKKGDKAWA